ncbi:MAG: hypothetical protein ABH871_05850 [Pseudomonadota bacterium]
MDLKNLLKFLRLIETIPLEYMVSGSIASILYGKPRLTQDMDIVVIFPLGKIDKFVSLFNPNEYYCPPPEAIKEAIGLGDQGHLNLIDQNTGFKIDIYPAREDPLILWGLENKKKVELIAGEEVWVAPPEYVILKKLAYYKEGGSQKHLEDIRGMLEVSGDQINTSIIEKWSSKLGLMDCWKQASQPT